MDAAYYLKPAVRLIALESLGKQELQLVRCELGAVVGVVEEINERCGTRLWRRVSSASGRSWIGDSVFASVGNQQPLTRHAANEGCAEEFH
jgi:hypothetical protein